MPNGDSRTDAEAATAAAAAEIKPLACRGCGASIISHDDERLHTAQCAIADIRKATLTCKTCGRVTTWRRVYRD